MVAITTRYAINIALFGEWLAEHGAELVGTDSRHDENKYIVRLVTMTREQLAEAAERFIVTKRLNPYL